MSKSIRKPAATLRRIERTFMGAFKMVEDASIVDHHRRARRAGRIDEILDSVDHRNEVEIEWIASEAK